MSGTQLSQRAASESRNVEEMECIEILGGYCVEHLQKFIPSSSMTDHEFFRYRLKLPFTPGSGERYQSGICGYTNSWTRFRKGSSAAQSPDALRRKAKSRLVAHSLVLGIFDKETFVFAFLETSVS